MIKKFNEYLKENLYITKNKHLGDFIKKEDIEDQFLRLEEVLGCKVTMYSGSLNDLNDINNINVFVTKIDGPGIYEYDKDIFKEISNIKNRIESMYLPVKVDLNKNSLWSGGNSFQIKISIWSFYS